MNEQTIGGALPRYTAPLSLRTSVFASLEATQEGAWPKFVLRWVLPLASTLAFGVWIGTLLPFEFGRSLDQELVWDHIHALRSNKTIAVVSSDKHTVKPWFAGKVDFSPTVIDLSAQGFPLLGGRTDQVNGHDAGVLVYSAGKHYIELFEWPKTRSVSNSIETYRGYQSARFSLAEMQCYAVSDASREEILKFQQTLIAEFNN